MDGKWVEVFPTKKMSSEITKRCLQVFFCTFGLLCSVVSDKAAYFKRKAGTDFCSARGIEQKSSAPFHPANGQVEVYSQTI